jgi:hypothetical protein
VPQREVVEDEDDNLDHDNLLTPAVDVDEADDTDDEDYDPDQEERENDMYQSKFDSMDEVLYFRDFMVDMQQQNPAISQFMNENMS